jgi:GT2 family glycosyltransferase
VTSTFEDVISIQFTPLRLRPTRRAADIVLDCIVTGPAQNGERDPRWEGVLERLAGAQPVVWCDWPQLSQDVVAEVDGELRFDGWAVSPAEIASVTVEVGGHGTFAAQVRRRRPDVRKAFHPARWARRPGFEAAIPTADWLPGNLDVTIRAHDRAGRSASQSGSIAWRPSRAELAVEFAAGAPALWVGEPSCGTSDPLAEELSVRGWVSARDVVESVVVELEGLEPAHAFVGEKRYEPEDDLPMANFAIVLDARGLDAATRTLTVRAITLGGSSTRRSGSVVVDPVARYRRRLPAATADNALSTESSADQRVELHVFVTESDPEDALLASLAAQDRTPADVTTVQGDLDEALALLHEAPGRVGVLAAGRDVLTPQALSTVAACFETDAPPDLVYSDHDTRDVEGHGSATSRKPGWSPELLLSFAYVGSFVALGPRAAEAARQAVARRAAGTIGSVHALLLALADEPLSVARIPRVLWSREARDFPEVSEREDDALHALAARRGARLTVTDRDPRAGVRTVEWMVERQPSVSVVIPTTGREEPLSACLRSLTERTDYPRVEVVLVDSGGAAGEAAEAAGVGARVVPYQGPDFNFSRACNLGAAHARGAFVAFVNDDVEALDGQWLARMVAQAQLPTIGVVGAKLIYPGGLVQHAGLFLDRLSESPDPDFVAAQFAFHQDSADMRRLMNLPRDCSAVTGACLLMRTEVLGDLGGWDERFRIDFGDVDLCLRAIQSGRRVLVEPRARLLHQVHATQGDQPHDEDDARRFRDRWAAVYPAGDPWHHPACSFDRSWEAS